MWVILIVSFFIWGNTPDFELHEEKVKGMDPGILKDLTNIFLNPGLYVIAGTILPLWAIGFVSRKIHYDTQYVKRDLENKSAED